MICYAFPLEHEAGEILKQCTNQETFCIGTLKCTLANFHNRPVLIALIGMGRDLALENTVTLFQYFRPRGFVLAGYGGALVPPLKTGQVVVCANFSSEAVLGFLRLLSGFDFASFCTIDEVVGTPELREAYAQESEAQVADMETEAVASVVEARQIPFLAVRAISDEYGHFLPLGALAAGFDPVRGKSTPGRLLFHLLTHPAEILPMKRFVSGLFLARRNLSRFLVQLNEELPASW